MSMRAALFLLCVPLCAVANPCGTPPKSTVRTAPSWIALHQAVTGAKSPAKDVATATSDLCTHRPCAPDAAISLLEASGALWVSLKTSTGYRAIELPLIAPDTAYDPRLTVLGGGWVHVHMDHEVNGHERYCDDADRGPDGECKEWTLATTDEGYSHQDALVDVKAGALRWAQDYHGEGSGRPSGVVRAADGRLGYWSPGATASTAWFRLTGTTCAPAPAPIDVKATLKTARQKARRGSLPAAIAAFDTLLAHAPGHAAWLSERGYLRFKAGDHQGAIGDLEAALKARPDDPLAGVIHFNRGLLREASSDTASALQDFKRADELRPSKAAKAKIKALSGR